MVTIQTRSHQLPENMRRQVNPAIPLVKFNHAKTEMVRFSVLFESMLISGNLMKLSTIICVRAAVFDQPLSFVANLISSSIKP